MTLLLFGLNHAFCHSGRRLPERRIPAGIGLRLAASPKTAAAGAMSARRRCS